LSKRPSPIFSRKTRFAVRTFCCSSAAAMPLPTQSAIRINAADVFFMGGGPGCGSQHLERRAKERLSV
jgi:hypothetical protein